MRKSSQKHAEDLRIIALVCRYFCEGYPPGSIAELLSRDHKIMISREAPYKMLTVAASRQWLRFVPPLSSPVADRLRTRFPSAQEIKVVDIGDANGVMEIAADVVLELLQKRRNQPEVRIGFGGGRSMLLLTKKLNHLIGQQMKDLPRTIICYNLVAGFDARDPKTNPISFFSEMVGLKPCKTEVECRIFQTPPMVPIGERDQMLKALQNQEILEAEPKFDIIVTSCGGIDDKHQLLGRFYNDNQISALSRLGCIGDMLWLPICADGPLRYEDLAEDIRNLLKYRTMSLIELDDLSTSIAEKKTDVVLAAAPCGKCNADKSDVISTILSLSRPIVTHAVIDIASAIRIDGLSEKRFH